MSHLFLSPHLDDVAFSCSATLARLIAQDVPVELITVFTGSVAASQGFALACQTDKGLAPGVDYMSLRRKEDAQFCRILGVENFAHWEFREAPHRGYNSAPELFAGEHPGDEVWRDIAARLRALSRPETVFLPQGLGNHVDHLQTIRAALQVFPLEILHFYRDTPYAIRQPDARPTELLPRSLKAQVVPFGDDELFQKIAGCCAYETQIGFQFGGAMELACKLTAFHRAEAQSVGLSAFAERFLAL